MKFKVGDKVRVIAHRGFHRWNLGRVGTIVYVTGINYDYLVRFESEQFDKDWGFEDDLERWGREESSTIKQSITMKVTNLVKRLLDADTQALVKAEYINGDLELTEKGQTELLSLVFLDKKADLVKLAQDELDESKATK